MKRKYVSRLGIFVAASLFAVSVSTTVPAEPEPGEETAWESGESVEEEAPVLTTSPGEAWEESAGEPYSDEDQEEYEAGAEPVFEEEDMADGADPAYADDAEASGEVTLTEDIESASEPSGEEVDVDGAEDMEEPSGEAAPEEETEETEEAFGEDAAAEDVETSADGSAEEDVEAGKETVDMTETAPAEAPGSSDMALATPDTDDAGPAGADQASEGQDEASDTDADGVVHTTEDPQTNADEEDMDAPEDEDNSEIALTFVSEDAEEPPVAAGEARTEEILAPGPVRLIGNAGGEENDDAVFTDELVVRSTSVAPPDDAEAVLPAEEAEAVEESAMITEAAADSAQAVVTDVEVLVPETLYAQSGPTVLVGDAGTSVTRTPTPTGSSSSAGVSTRTAGSSESQTGSGSSVEDPSSGAGSTSGTGSSAGSTSGTGGGNAVPARTSAAASKSESPKTGDVSTPFLYIGMMSCSLTAMIDQTFKLRQRRKK